MKPAELLALYDRDQRIEVSYPNTRRETFPNLIRNVPLDTDESGFIIYTDLDENETDDVIREQIDYFSNLGLDFEWKLYAHDNPPDLKDRLARHGFEIGEEEAILILEIDQAPSFLRAPIHQDVRKVTGPDQIAAIVDLENRVWNEDHSDLRNFLEKTLQEQPDLFSIYLAYVDDQPASAGWTYFPQGSQFASLWGGSTLPEYRNRGLYTALLATRLQEAKQRGVRFLTVDASPMSRPILEKYGFVFVDYSYPCTYKIKSQ